MNMIEKSLPMAIVVHGGAWDIPAEYQEAHVKGCVAAANVGWQVLLAGGSALDAIESAIRLMEDDPTYDAGIGSLLSAEGTVELDAGLMDGETLKIGAVAAVKHYATPISIARRVLEKTNHHFFVGAGAEAYAASEGFEAIENEALIVEREWAAYQRFRAGTLTAAESVGGHDTVGAVALVWNPKMWAFFKYIL